MTSISKFDANVYSEEVRQVSEADYDEVMSLMAEPSFEGYSQWSQFVEGDAEREGQTFSEGDVENFYIKGGKVYHKPEPEGLGRKVVVI